MSTLNISTLNNAITTIEGNTTELRFDIPADGFTAEGTNVMVTVADTVDISNATIYVTATNVVSASKDDSIVLVTVANGTLTADNITLGTLTDEGVVNAPVSLSVADNKLVATLTEAIGSSDGSDNEGTDGSDDKGTDGSDNNDTDGSDNNDTDGSDDKGTDGSDNSDTDGSDDKGTDGSEETPVVEKTFVDVTATSTEGMTLVEKTTDIIKVISPETALVDYETKVQDIAEADLATIEADKKTVSDAQQLAYSAIQALDDGDKKNELLTRYNTAYEQQCEAYKLLYLYYSKNSHLTLFKVNNIGGNVPFNIIFKDDILIGSASEAFYYAPGSNVPVSLVISNPKQTNILFGAEGTVAGEYVYVYKIGDKYYRTVVDASVEDNVVTINSVDGIEIPAIANTGDSYTVPSEVVDKSQLASLLAEAQALLDAHSVGEAPGNVPQTAYDALSKVVEDAKAVNDNADAQSDEVSAQIEALPTAVSDFKGFIIKYYVDETALQTAVDDANKLVEGAVVGDQVGQTTQENIDAYKAAIITAQKVLDDTPSNVDYDNTEVYNAYVQTVSDALTALNDATNTYNNGVITSYDYANTKLTAYENYAKAFLENVRKKITI